MTAVGATGARWQDSASPAANEADRAAAGPSPDRSRGYPVGDGTFAASVRGTAPQPERDLQFAMMANDAYASNADGPTGTQSERELAAAGWQRLTPVGDRLVDAQGRAIPLAPDLLHDPKAGFDAAIYQNAHGQYVVAFRGTDNWSLGPGGDSTTNGGQGIGLPTAQYTQAVQLAKQAVAAFGEGNVAFTGHSMGGGLASAAMLAVDAPGVTFNAAGLSDNTLRRLGLGQSANSIRAQVADSGQIRRYNVEAEPLASLQQGTPLPDAVGHEWRVAAAHGISPFNPAARHGGSGDGTSYVEALRQNTAYRPAGAPPLWRAVEQSAEAGANVLASLGVNLHQGGVRVGAAVQDTAGVLANVAREEFARGEIAPGALRATGALANGALDLGAGVAASAADLAGDVVMEASTLAGHRLRDGGARLGLAGPANALAALLETTGEQANGAIDRAGAALANGLDLAGDVAAWAADRAADGVRWVGDQLADGARWTLGKFGEGAQWLGDQAAGFGRWASRLNPFAGT